MQDFISDVMKLKADTDKLYIYGAGSYGQNLYKILQNNHIEVDGFVVTHCSDRKKTVQNLPVIEIDSVIHDNLGLVLGLSKFNTIEVMQYLKQKNFDLDRVLCYSYFVRHEDDALNENPIVEITTRIGCSVNCYYCPQNLLISTYFKGNTHREAVMSIETFTACLEKLPKNCDVVFSGMAEAFLNPDCLEMIKLALASGRRVELFTTLVGASPKDIDELCRLNLNLLTLHVADKFGHAKIPVSDEYYRMVQTLIESKKADGTPLVDICSAQVEPDEKIKEICKGKCEILTVMQDRAGNLQGENLLHQEGLKGKISCATCKQNFNRNILLPDGTLLLCCMDYGMKHVLGNLLHMSYEEIMNGEEMKKVKQGAGGDESIDILCRGCSLAHAVE